MKKWIRLCVSCRTLNDRRLMLKVTNQKEILIIEPACNQFGRSAYMCASSDCVSLARKFGKLERSLKFTCIEGNFWDRILIELNKRTVLKMCG